MRGLGRLFGNWEEFGQFFWQILNYLPALFVLLLGIYVWKNFKHSGGTMTFVGALIRTLTVFGYMYMNFVYMQSDNADYDMITTIYAVLNFVGLIGSGLFFYGLYQVLQGKLTQNSRDSQDTIFISKI